MTHVITEPCKSEKDKSCVSVCPVDCIHEGTVEVDGTVYNQLFIDPDICIDCGLCVSQCPVDAIFMNVEVPEAWQPYVRINAEFYRTGRRA